MQIMSTELKVPPDFDIAPSEQRIAFVQELWERIAAHPEHVPLPPEHRKVLDERLNEYRTNPAAGRPWGEVRDELLTKLRER
jgi:putative addiction module component (TIGR02574 family)